MTQKDPGIVFFFQDDVTLWANKVEEYESGYKAKVIDGGWYFDYNISTKILRCCQSNWNLNDPVIVNNDITLHNTVHVDPNMVDNHESLYYNRHEEIIDWAKTKMGEIND